MSVLPQSCLEQIQFYEQRLPLWAASTTLLSLTAPEIVALTTAVNAARIAFTAAQVARDNSKSATVAFYAACEVMNKLGRDAIRTIKNEAESTNNPAVYVASNIEPPAEPTPLGPPATPTDVTAVINNEGQAELKWDGSREGGTSFTIERSVTPVGGTQGPWVLLASVEERQFIDVNVPFGLASALYRIKAQRTGGISVASEPGQILFGTPAQQQAATGLTLAA